MADPTPTPAPPADWRTALRAAGVAFLKYVLPPLVASLLTYFNVPPEVREVVKEVIKEVPVQAPGAGPGGENFDGGWVPPTPLEKAVALDPTQTLHFANTPAGVAVMGDEDVYLWRVTYKYARGPPWVDQGPVGCCVGAGYKHGCDVCEATTVARSGGLLEWRPIAVEPIYAGSRNEIGNGVIRGDGSSGGWAAKFVTTYGAAPAQKYDSVDLTTFSPARARAMGASGRRLPADVVAAAKANPVKSAALVKSFADVARAIRQGYPVPVCSDVGFAGMRRDADGFIRPSGTWNHCMCFIAVRGGKRPGAFCLNNWGDKAHTGPVYPSDAPVAGFWVDADVVDRMARQADTYALSDMAGFPNRQPPPAWFIRAEPAVRPFDPFTRRPAPPVLAKPASVGF